MTSIRPKDMVEGGGPPVGLSLTIKEAKFVVWDYDQPQKKIQALAARLTLVDDQGIIYVQNYSAGDPQRFAPSSDGKTVVPRGNATALNAHSNLAVLMQAMVNAGFPEDKLGGEKGNDISSITGLYAYWEGVAAPERPGLQQREGKIISVPVRIQRLPWESVESTKTEEASADLEEKALEVLSAAMDGKADLSRQDFSKFVFRQLRGDPMRNELSRFIFSKEFLDVAMTAGYEMTGESIKRL